MDYSEWAISYVRAIVTNVLDWFMTIMSESGMGMVWTGVVVFVAVFSIIIMPLRGGAPLGGGISDVVMNQTHKSKRSQRERSRQYHGQD